MLRVCAAARAEHGREAVAALYTQMGSSIFDVEPSDRPLAATVETIEPLLHAANLPPGLVTALDEDAWDAEIEAETEEALSRTGRDVGTPIIHFQPPDGVAFFGPVISRLPSDEDALRLWDHVLGLASFPGFAELKRSLREVPQLRSLGAPPDGEALAEDWHAGSRRLKS